jgi:ABC-type multidrug transport system fused ATPase/permease subunit
MISAGLTSMLTGTVRALYRWLTSLLFVAIVVQVGLAGYGAFDAVHKSESGSASKQAVENGFSAHITLGYLIVLVMIVMLIVAAAGRLGSSNLKFSGALVILGVLQAILGMASESTPAIGPLHTINALAIYAVSALLAHRTWTAHRAASATA